METAETLSETLAVLSKKGYTNNFQVREDALFCIENNMKLDPGDFEISEYYSFEGLHDLEDGSVAYAIKSDKLNIKGVLIDAYGAYADPVITDFILKVKMPKSIFVSAKLRPA